MSNVNVTLINNEMVEIINGEMVINMCGKFARLKSTRRIYNSNEEYQKEKELLNEKYDVVNVIRYSSEEGEQLQVEYELKDFHKTLDKFFEDKSIIK